MTLQQLKYAVVTAEKGTVSEAAAALYIAQPSLTKAIKELEKEMGITIFHRTNKGVSVSKEGEVLPKNMFTNPAGNKNFAYPHSTILLQ